MFSNILSNNSANKIASNNGNGRRQTSSSSASGGGFWSASSVWNLLPKSRTKPPPSKYNYQDLVDDGPAANSRLLFEQQRHGLIGYESDPEEDGGAHVREIEMNFLRPPPIRDLLDEEDEVDVTVMTMPTPPVSPSMFILPRCMDDNQFFSPVKLAAGPERMSQRRRIQFAEEDDESLIEKFDRISMMKWANRDQEDKENIQQVANGKCKSGQTSSDKKASKKKKVRFQDHHQNANEPKGSGHTQDNDDSSSTTVGYSILKGSQK